MKFREEVFAKICTFVTVFILFAIVIFEAISLQGARRDAAETKEQAQSVQESLQKMIDVNAGLQEKNDELAAFQKEWSPYAAFLESKEVLTLRYDLFSRPDLIPQQVKDALNRMLDEREGRTEPSEVSLSKEEKKEKEKEEKETEEEVPPRELKLTFSNPDGEDIFLPLSIGVGDEEACLVYTAAFEKEYDAVVELVFEIAFEKQRSVVARDENGKINWTCVAFNLGEGWQGFVPEQTGEETETE